MVRTLLQRGASLNLQDFSGGTALMGAAITGNTSIVQVLLDAKADASLQDIEGDTALKWAEQEKHTATAQLLRQHAKRPTEEAEARAAVAATHVEAAAPTPNLSGRRVRIFGLKGRPELNGRSGVAGRFDAAKGRYEVAVEGEAEAVLLKPANLQDAGCGCLKPQTCLTSSLPHPIPNPDLSLMPRWRYSCLKPCSARRTRAMCTLWLDGWTRAGTWTRAAQSLMTRRC